MKLLAEAIAEFVRQHGHKPSELAVTCHAALALSCLGPLTGVYDGVKLRVDLFDGSDAKPPGTGNRVGLFVRKDAAGHQIMAVELR